jgi:hypothetical protein
MLVTGNEISTADTEAYFFESSEAVTIIKLVIINLTK